MRASILALFLSFTVSIIAQPAWMDAENRTADYPSDQYLFGFVSIDITDDDLRAYEYAKEFSISNLSDQIMIQVVNSEVTGELTFFDKNSLNISTLESADLQTEYYLDSVENRVYAFSFLSKRNFIKSVYKEMYEQVDELKKLVITLDTVELKGQNELISEFSGFLLASRFRQDVLRKLDVSNKTVLMQDQLNLFQEILDEIVDKAQNEGGMDVNDKVSLLVAGLVAGLSDNVESINILPITFQNSNVGTEFSAFFQDVLESRIKQEVQVSNDIFNRYKLSGTYWKRDDQIQIAISIKEYDGSEPYKTLVSESLFLPKEEIENLGLTYILPENHKIVSGSVFLLNEPNGGLQASLTTQKGNRSLIFKAGDILELTVSVSHPSFIRLINVAADGTQISVLDNYYVAEANKSVEMPFQWQTQCPCGTEYLKLLTQTRPFEEQEVIVNEDGYEIIQGNLQLMINQMRSNQRDTKSVEEAFCYGESHLIVTTLE